MSATSDIPSPTGTPTPTASPTAAVTPPTSDDGHIPLLYEAYTLDATKDAWQPHKDTMGPVVSANLRTFYEGLSRLAPIHTLANTAEATFEVTFELPSPEEYAKAQPKTREEQEKQEKPTDLGTLNPTIRLLDQLKDEPDQLALLLETSVEQPFHENHALFLTHATLESVQSTLVAPVGLRTNLVALPLWNGVEAPDEGAAGDAQEKERRERETAAAQLRTGFVAVASADQPASARPLFSASSTNRFELGVYGGLMVCPGDHADPTAWAPDWANLQERMARGIWSLPDHPPKQEEGAKNGGSSSSKTAVTSYTPVKTAPASPAETAPSWCRKEGAHWSLIDVQHPLFLHLEEWREHQQQAAYRRFRQELKQKKEKEGQKSGKEDKGEQEQQEQEEEEEEEQEEEAEGEPSLEAFLEKQAPVDLDCPWVFQSDQSSGTPLPFALGVVPSAFLDPIFRQSRAYMTRHLLREIPLAHATLSIAPLRDSWDTVYAEQTNPQEGRSDLATTRPTVTVTLKATFAVFPREMVRSSGLCHTLPIKEAPEPKDPPQKDGLSRVPTPLVEEDDNDLD